MYMPLLRSPPGSRVVSPTSSPRSTSSNSPRSTSSNSPRGPSSTGRSSPNGECKEATKITKEKEITRLTEKIQQLELELMCPIVQDFVPPNEARFAPWIDSKGDLNLHLFSYSGISAALERNSENPVNRQPLTQKNLMKLIELNPDQDYSKKYQDWTTLQNKLKKLTLSKDQEGNDYPLFGHVVEIPEEEKEEEILVNQPPRDELANPNFDDNIWIDPVSRGFVFSSFADVSSWVAYVPIQMMLGNYEIANDSYVLISTLSSISAFCGFLGSLSMIRPDNLYPNYYLVPAKPYLVNVTKSLIGGAVTYFTTSSILESTLGYSEATELITVLLVPFAGTLIGCTSAHYTKQILNYGYSAITKVVNWFCPPPPQEPDLEGI